MAQPVVIVKNWNVDCVGGKKPNNLIEWKTGSIEGAEQM